MFRNSIAFEDRHGLFDTILLRHFPMYFTKAKIISLRYEKFGTAFTIKFLDSNCTRYYIELSNLNRQCKSSTIKLGFTHSDLTCDTFNKVNLTRPKASAISLTFVVYKQHPYNKRVFFYYFLFYCKIKYQPCVYFRKITKLKGPVLKTRQTGTNNNSKRATIVSSDNIYV